MASRFLGILENHVGLGSYREQVVAGGAVRHGRIAEADRAPIEIGFRTLVSLVPRWPGGRRTLVQWRRSRVRAPQPPAGFSARFVEQRTFDIM